MTRTSGLALLWLIASTLCVSDAHAWGNLLLIDAPPTQDALAIGASVWALPRSPQGTHESRSLTPALEYRRHDGWFASTEMGLGFNVSHSEDWQAGWRLWPQFGRARQDEATGSAHLGTRLQKQLYANHMLGQVALLQSALSYGSGASQNGLQTELGITSGVPMAGGMLGLGMATSYGNRVYQRDYMGMDRPGWSDWSWVVNLDHRFNGRWHLDAQYQRAYLAVSGSGAQAAVGRAHPHAAILSIWRDL